MGVEGWGWEDEWWKRKVEKRMGGGSLERVVVVVERSAFLKWRRLKKRH